MDPDPTAPHLSTSATRAAEPEEVRPSEPMSPFARAVARSMASGTLLACFWVTIGRTYIGGGGWMTLLILGYGTIPMILLLLPALFVAAQGMGRRPRISLHEAEAVAQATVWGGMFLVGLCLTDFGDVPGSTTSVAARLTGAPANSEVFSALVVIGLICVALGWFGQMCLLLRGRPAPPAPTAPRRPPGYGPIG